MSIALSNREYEEMQLSSDLAQQDLEEVDVRIAKMAPEVWYTAGIVREYFDALRATFKDEEETPIISNDQILRIVIGTVNIIRAK